MVPCDDFIYAYVSANLCASCLKLPDRAGHSEVPLRGVGHPVPAAQAGGRRAISAAARRPLLPRVRRLHLPVVSLERVPVHPGRDISADDFSVDERLRGLFYLALQRRSNHACIGKKMHLVRRRSGVKTSCSRLAGVGVFYCRVWLRHLYDPQHLCQ